MAKDRTVDVLFTIWIEGMHLMFVDIVRHFGKQDTVGGSELRNIVNDTVLGMIENQDKWIPSDNEDDIFKKMNEIMEYLQPLKIKIINFVNRFPDDDKNEWISFSLDPIFGSIQTAPTMFSYAYIKDVIGEIGGSKKMVTNITFTEDKDSNILMIKFWKYIIQRFAFKIILNIKYRAPETKEYPLCFIRLKEILTRTFKQFRNSELQLCDMEGFSINYARPVDEAIRRFIRHAQQWMVYHEDIDESKKKAALDFIEKLEILADFYCSLFPAVIAMSFESKE